MNRKKNESEDWKILLDQLKKVADEKGMTQEDIADKCGMIQSSISRIFSHAYAPRISTVVLIAEAIGVKLVVSDLAKFTGEVYKGIRISKIDPEGHRKAIDYFSGDKWNKPNE